MPLDEISTLTTHIRYLSRSGDVVHDDGHVYRFSSWNTVYRRLLGCFGRDRYRLGAEVTGFGSRATPSTSNWPTTPATGSTSSSVPTGSDHASAASCSPASNRSTPAMWRGGAWCPITRLDPAVVERLEDAITYFVYANSHILVYPIPGQDGSVERRRRLMNFVWYRNYLAGGDLADVLTDVNGLPHEISLPPGAARRGSRRRAARHGTGAAAGPDRVVVLAADAPFVQVIFDVEVSRMAFGRVCLVGDAAWVARPHAAAGTAKAAADGWALAAALAAHDDVPRPWPPGSPASSPWDGSSSTALGASVPAPRSRATGGRAIPSSSSASRRRGRVSAASSAPSGPRAANAHGLSLRPTPT